MENEQDGIIYHKTNTQGRLSAMDNDKKRSSNTRECKLRVIITHTRNLLWDDDDDDVNVAPDDNDDASK